MLHITIGLVPVEEFSGIQVSIKINTIIGSVEKEDIGMNLRKFTTRLKENVQIKYKRANTAFLRSKQKEFVKIHFVQVRIIKCMSTYYD